MSMKCIENFIIFGLCVEQRDHDNLEEMQENNGILNEDFFHKGLKTIAKYFKERVLS